MEINRLKEELSLLKPLVPSRRNYNASANISSSSGLDSSSHGGSIHEYGVVPSVVTKPAVSWLSLDYWFGGGASSSVVESGRIMKV